MTTTPTMTVEVSVYDEYYDEGPTHIRIPITEELINRVKKFSMLVAENDAYCMQKFDYSPSYIILDEDGNIDEEGTEKVRIECSTLNVTSHDTFHYKAIIKHTDIEVESQSIEVKEIEELLRVARTPLEELPVLMNSSENEDVISLIKERLKKGE